MGFACENDAGLTGLVCRSGTNKTRLYGFRRHIQSAGFSCLKFPSQWSRLPLTPSTPRAPKTRGWRSLASPSLFLIFTLLLPFAATAQEGFLFVPDISMPNMVGIGVGFVPDYEGSDDLTLAAGPLGRVNFGERYIALKANAVSANIVDHPYWRFGPSGTLRLGRDDVEDKLVDRLDDIDATVDLGAFFGVEFTNEVDPRIRFSADIDFQHDVGDVHDGFSVQASVRYWHPLAKWLDFGITGGAVYGSGQFMDTFFGIKAAEASRSGLSAFDADAGFKDVRVLPMLVAHVNENWHVGGGVMYKRLLGDAADSPIVADRGSENQFLGGLAVVYSW
jgi:MipA family protein